MRKEHQRFIQDVFYSVVDNSSVHKALVFKESSLTYAELNQQSNQLAHFIRSKGFKPEDRIALVLEKSFDFFIAMLAVIKSGCAFVLLELTKAVNHQERFKKCLEAAKSSDHQFYSRGIHMSDGEH